MALYLTKNVKNLLEKSSPTKRKEKIQSRSRYGISSNKNSRLEHLETLNIHQRINDGEISFVCKLRQCRILYDFNDREADLEGEQIKSEILQDIIDYLAQVRGVLSLTAYNEVIDMFSCNVFHTLPSIHITEAERKEDVSVEDVAWPHLKLVYQVFHNFLYSPGFKAVRAENFLNNKFISELLRLFNSEDNRERIALRNILSGIYCKFINKRNFIRKEVENIFLSYVYEDKYCNGIPQLLEIVPRIIMEFYRTSNGECSEFLTKVLLPLHKGKYFVLYHIRLVRCLLMYLTKYPVLFEPIVRQLLLVWPKSCAEKEIMFLEEIEILFQAVNVPEFMKVHDSLFRQIMKCIQSPHFQVSKYALILWSNKIFKRLINKITVVALPTIITTLYCSSKFHWHKQIREFSHFYLKVFLSDNFTTFYKSSYSDYRKLWENLEANLDLIKIGEICNNTKEQWSRKFLNPDHSVPFQYIEFHLSAFEHLLTSYAINQRQHEIGDSRTKILDQFYIRSTYPGSLCSHILICDNIPLSNIDTGSHSTRLQPTQQYIQNLQQLKEEQKGHKQPQVQTKPETEHRNLQQQDQKQPQLRKNLRLQHEDVPQQQMLQHQVLQRQEILRPLPHKSSQPARETKSKNTAITIIATTATNTTATNVTTKKLGATLPMAKIKVATAKNKATMTREYVEKKKTEAETKSKSVSATATVTAKATMKRSATMPISEVMPISTTLPRSATMPISAVKSNSATMKRSATMSKPATIPRSPTMSGSAIISNSAKMPRSATMQGSETMPSLAIMSNSATISKSGTMPRAAKMPRSATMQGSETMPSLAIMSNSATISKSGTMPRAATIPRSATMSRSATMPSAATMSNLATMSNSATPSRNRPATTGAITRATGTITGEAINKANTNAITAKAAVTVTKAKTDTTRATLTKANATTTFAGATSTTTKATSNKAKAKTSALRTKTSATITNKTAKTTKIAKTAGTSKATAKIKSDEIDNNKRKSFP